MQTTRRCIYPPEQLPAPGLIFIPNDPTYVGISFYVGFIAIPPAPALWGISDSLQLTIQ